MIACDLFAALAIADWPKREWTVLAEILLQQYGPQKRREAFVEPLMVEHLSGLGSKNVYRAIRNLKACNVIRDGSHGGIVFVKDYEQWVRCPTGHRRVPIWPILVLTQVKENQRITTIPSRAIAGARPEI
jgi:hypothetical protein